MLFVNQIAMIPNIDIRYMLDEKQIKKKIVIKDFKYMPYLYFVLTKRHIVGKCQHGNDWPCCPAETSSEEPLHRHTRHSGDDHIF